MIIFITNILKKNLYLKDILDILVIFVIYKHHQTFINVKLKIF